MASPKCRHGAPPTSASTMTSSSGSSGSTRPRSTACARAEPFPMPTNGRRSGQRMPGGGGRPTLMSAETYQATREADDGRDYYRTFREHPSRRTESSDKEERDDVEHVRDSRGCVQ